MKNLHASNGNMIKRNQRLNGYVKWAHGSAKYSNIVDTPDHHNHILNDNATNSLDVASVVNRYQDKLLTTIKDEPNKDDFDSKINIHSIIGLSNDESGQLRPISNIKPRPKRTNFRFTHHETLQRIDSVLDDQYNHYQQHWFSAGLERLKLEDRSREERLEITRYELRRQLKQLVRCNVGRAARLPPLVDWRTAVAASATTPTSTPSSAAAPPPYSAALHERLVAPRDCEECPQRALPCARHCKQHITRNSEQVLFGRCTAKFADNTQCAAPVFDVLHELPLCVEHARKRVRYLGASADTFTHQKDNYKMYQEAKPKKLRKKVKPSAMIRPQKRSKKKKKPSLPGGGGGGTTSSGGSSNSTNNTTTTNSSSSSSNSNPADGQGPASSSSGSSSTDVLTLADHHKPHHLLHGRLEIVPSCNIIESSEISDDLMTDVADESEELGEDMVEQVLGMRGQDALVELATVDVAQASHLLEETDITNVLSTIQADEFSDFFTVNRNGEYEPTREETEELERALAAVDHDVKSLEKLSQSGGLLDTFLEEHGLVESLVQSNPEVVFAHNGYGALHGAQTSRLLSVHPHSHS